jgi:anti-sigma factor RsiW
MMNMDRSQCNQLDDYMLGWLSGDEAAEFEHHLFECPACQHERELQQSIDKILLGIDGPLDAIPDWLADRARNWVQASRRRKTVRWTVSLMAAAAVLLLVILGRIVLWPSNRAVNQDVARLENTAGSRNNTSSNTPPFSVFEHPKVSSRVTLADPSTGIVLECKTRDPKINIVWIYPTVNQAPEPDDRPYE